MKLIQAVDHSDSELTVEVNFPVVEEEESYAKNSLVWKSPHRFCKFLRSCRVDYANGLFDTAMLHKEISFNQFEDIRVF